MFWNKKEREKGRRNVQYHKKKVRKEGKKKKKTHQKKKNSLLLYLPKKYGTDARSFAMSTPAWINAGSKIFSIQ